MTTVGQLETAIRDFIEECKKQSDSEWPCLQCPYEHFCDRFYTGDGSTWHWRVYERGE